MVICGVKKVERGLFDRLLTQQTLDTQGKDETRVKGTDTHVEKFLEIEQGIKGPKV